MHWLVLMKALVGRGRLPSAARLMHASARPAYVRRSIVASTVGDSADRACTFCQATATPAGPTHAPFDDSDLKLHATPVREIMRDDTEAI